MLHKTFVAGLLLSVAFVPNAYAGFEFVSPVAPVAASQQAVPAAIAAAPLPVVPTTNLSMAAPLPATFKPVPAAMPVAPKMQGLMKANTSIVPAVKADESDALLLSDEVLAEPPKAAPPVLSPMLPPILSAAPIVAPVQSKPVSVALPVVAVAPKVVSGATLLPVVQADMPTAKAAPVTYEVVQGFGKQVPLALALRQIVPADYRFSFASGVNAGQMVDWQGGQPWDQVVSMMAKENALLVRITNQVVLIEQDPNGAKAPVLSSMMPSSVMLALPPLAAVNTTKKSPAFAGDNPLVLALGETLPTRDTEDMSLNQPRRSFQKPISLTARLPAPTGPMIKAAALPTSLMPIATAAPTTTMPVVTTKMTPALPTDALLAQKAAQPALAPVTMPEPAVNNIAPVSLPNNLMAKLDANSAVNLPAALPPLPKARSIDVAKKAAPPATPTNAMPVAELAKPAIDKENMAAKPVVKVANAHQLPQLKTTEIKPSPLMPASMLDAPQAPQAIETAKAVQQTWVAEKGQTMRQAFANWAPDAGVTLIWSAAYDYPLQTDVAINGTFQDAVRTMLDGFSKAQPRPVGRLHKNGATGNAVLVVETRQATE